MYTMG
jgi:hypothetical protein